MVVADLVSYAIPALVGAVVGWTIRQSAARSKEAALKLNVLDAKAAVPKLESSIRNRDQQVSTLEDQVSALTQRVSSGLRVWCNARVVSSWTTVLCAFYVSLAGVYCRSEFAPCWGNSSAVIWCPASIHRAARLLEGW